MATPTRSIVVPALPPIDKYIAEKRVLLDWRGVPVKFEVEFCGRNIPRREDYQRWDRGNPHSAIIIDLGDAKYHHGYQSASDMAKMMSHTDGGATWNRLQELANQNNRSGFLKQRRHSVAKLIREIYHLGSGWPDLNWYRICWAHCKDVVDSFFWRMDGRNWDTLFTDPTYAELRKIWEGFDVQEKEVLEFTLPLYFRKLFRSGRPIPLIMQRMSWWLDNQRKVESRREQARRKRYQFKAFHLKGQPAGLVHINDYWEAEAFSYNHLGAPRELVLGIIRNPRGGAVVQCSFRHELDLENLSRALAKQEPDRTWHFEPRFSSGHMIMNQSWQFYEETATSLSDDELIRIAYNLARYLGPKGQPRTQEGPAQPVDPTALRLGFGRKTGSTATIADVTAAKSRGQ